MAKDIKLKDVSVRKIPEDVWNNFSGTCKQRGISVAQGLIEATKLWVKTKRAQNEKS